MPQMIYSINGGSASSLPSYLTPPPYHIIASTTYHDKPPPYSELFSASENSYNQTL